MYSNFPGTNSVIDFNFSASNFVPIEGLSRIFLTVLVLLQSCLFFETFTMLTFYCTDEVIFGYKTIYFAKFLIIVRAYLLSCCKNEVIDFSLSENVLSRLKRNN